ncbi:30S ribosome-binding factor RbfA [candidate division KSB1 bacterium]|nr:30S ribosome-binding factor RbfA [candidate division KSB1 bacterium]NIR70418.1 30S ribosome-binding factor RbfA [candidate division KSB1 bacterium]NIS25958.1 30S ribosome-binding factor RbfA [candidate division KSB1 bacterium]NIT69981.1 30S ribosome-binding factor RbfA [candidate division KSB1 bacterium]NIU26646.1 30S ribosome-binding factor RbfA [candidate division KSB1 bacterium]
MRQYKRSKRVAQLLREEISKIITQELKDPLIGMVTVTTIKLTEDLKSARVFVSIIGDNDAINKSLRGLERAKNWIRSELGQRTDLKYVPRLDFYYDDTIEHAQNIESLLKQIHNN